MNKKTFNYFLWIIKQINNEYSNEPQYYFNIIKWIYFSRCLPKLKLTKYNIKNVLNLFEILKKQ